MSSANTEFSLGHTREEVLRACFSAAADMGWRVTAQHAAGLICEEPPAGPFSFTNPASITLSLRDNGNSSTFVTLQGSNAGFGPIQSSHVKRQVASLQEAILRRVPGAAVPTTPGPSSSPTVATQPTATVAGGVWGWLKDAAGQAVQYGTSYMRYRSFIQSLFQMTPDHAYHALQQQVGEMTREDYQTFTVALSALIGEARQALAQSQRGSSWGNSFEDRTAQFLAEAQSGFPSSNRSAQAEQYLQGLLAVQQHAQEFHYQAVAQPAVPDSTVPSQPSAKAPEHGGDTHSPLGPEASSIDDIERELEAFVLSGTPNPALMQKLISMNDPQAMERVLAKLDSMGANEGTSPPLNIADYYKPGDGKLTLGWPLSPYLPLTMDFDELDRETQFHVLFGEWTRRELEGNQALLMGDLEQAEEIFKECLERADQLGVAELRARSYEGMMRLAQRRGNREAERRWLDAALDARDAG